MLALAGVPADAIAADHALSDERLVARYAARGEPDPAPALVAFLAEQGTSAAAIIADLLGERDIEATPRAGGLTAADVAALRARLLE